VLHEGADPKCRVRAGVGMDDHMHVQLQAPADARQQPTAGKAKVSRQHLHRLQRLQRWADSSGPAKQDSLIYSWTCRSSCCIDIVDCICNCILPPPVVALPS
jgi:hypothetical protein